MFVNCKVLQELLDCAHTGMVNFRLGILILFGWTFERGFLLDDKQDNAANAKSVLAESRVKPYAFLPTIAAFIGTYVPDVFLP